MKVQGRRSDKLKLDGFIEKAGRSSIHYQSALSRQDGLERHDLLPMISTLFLLSAQAPFGKIGVTDPFFYQF